MKQTDRAVQLLLPEIQGKWVLEPACGTGAFSLSASPYAAHVDCIDLDPHRLNQEVLNRQDLSFRQMDAGNMDFADEAFDTVVFYNALFHIKDQWPEILAECRRVLKPGGKILILGSWKLDVSLMEEMFGDQVRQADSFNIVEILK